MAVFQTYGGAIPASALKDAKVVQRPGAEGQMVTWVQITDPRTGQTKYLSPQQAKDVAAGRQSGLGAAAGKGHQLQWDQAVVDTSTAGGKGRGFFHGLGQELSKAAKDPNSWYPLLALAAVAAPAAMGAAGAADAGGAGAAGAGGAGGVGAGTGGLGAGTGGLTAGEAAGTAAGATGGLQQVALQTGTSAAAKTAANDFLGISTGDWLKGAATIGGDLLQQKAIGDATKTAQETAQQQAALYEPYRKAGTAALGRISDILSGKTKVNLSQIPGYQAGLEAGSSAISREAAAQGTRGGGTLASLFQFGQQYAGKAYNDYMSQLGGVANLGATAGVPGVSNAIGSAGYFGGQAQLGSASLTSNTLGTLSNLAGEYFDNKQTTTTTTAGTSTPVADKQQVWA